MAWAKIDDGMWSHRKVVNAGNEAVGAWARMICFCCENATDGLLTDAEALEIAKRRPVLVKLVEAKLLDPLSAGGYKVHNFDVYNLTGEAAVKARETRKEKARKGARVRWSAPPDDATEHAREDANGHATEHAAGHSREDARPMLGGSPDPRDPERPRTHAPPPEPARVWGLGVWEPLWTNTLRCRPADRHKDGRDRWRDLVERIGTDAVLLDPPMEPAAYAEALMRALPAYAEHAARKGGEEVPSVSVAAFEGWYPKLAAWVAQRRPKGKRAAPAAAAAAPSTAPPAPAAAPEPEAPPLTAEEAERQAADARDAMDQLFKRGKYAPQSPAADSGGDEDQPPTL